MQARALHDGQDSGQALCITTDEIAMTLKTRIAREHLAQIMLACAAEPAALGQTVSVYGGRAAEVTEQHVRSLLNSALSK